MTAAQTKRFCLPKEKTAEFLSAGMKRCDAGQRMVDESQGRPNGKYHAKGCDSSIAGLRRTNMWPCKKSAIQRSPI